MLENNPIPFQSRIKELFIDWLVICIYLLCLFGASMLLYHLTLGRIPLFSELQSQLIATFFSVIPIILIFSYLDYNGGSSGKRKSKRQLHFKKKTFLNALLRNILKFTPWQLGHIGTIRAIYQDYDTTGIILQWIAILLLLLMSVMGFFRKDKRHLGDLLAGTQVRIER